MTERDVALVEFPREQYLDLLQVAQQLFTTKDARKKFLHDLDISMESPSAAQPQEISMNLARDPGVTQQSRSTAKSGIDLGTAGTSLDYMSTARFATALVDELSTPERLNQSITLARRIARALPEYEARADALIAKLQALYRSHRVRAVQAGDSPDLEGYQRWRGFECAHEYSLSDRFFGRKAQLKELDAWITSDPGNVSVYCICALGGSGKSALAWHWLEKSLPRLRQNRYQGAFWCSFYEKNFSFETFLKRLLRFAGQVSDENLENLTRVEIEAKLLETLEKNAFVVVVDGLERLMNGYAVTFDRAVDPDSVEDGKHESELTSYDRQLTDLRDGAFLRRLARDMASRVLITTRLRPADLEQSGSETPLPHAAFSDRGGLDFADLAELWYSIVPECPLNEELKAIFVRSGNHPLIVSILARSVAKSGGDWQAWKENPAHQDFRPGRTLTDAQVRAHLIGVCMRDLHEMACDVLGVLTTSGKPMVLSLIAQILLRGSAESGDDRWTSEEQVALELAELVSLGLIGLAEQTEPPEYDVHPVVRGATWNMITDGGRERFLTHALSEFLATPNQSAPDEGLELNKAISLMRLLVQAGEVDRAWEMYFNRLYWPLTLRSENRTLRDLFELLLPDGNVFRLLPLESRVEQGNATHTLGTLLMEAGDGSRSDELLRWTGAIRLQAADFIGFLDARRSRTWQTMYEGKLFETERALREMKLDAMRLLALEIIPGIDVWIGMVRAITGRNEEARSYFESGETPAVDFRWWAQGAAEGWVYVGNPDEAISLLDRLAPWQPSDGKHQLAWEQLTRGMALFQKKEYAAAWDELADCLQAASRSDYAIIQCFALPYIAEIQLERGEIGEAEERLKRYSDLDPNDQYKLSAADVWRVRARCRLASGNRATALKYASKAYILAACDGPPFTYASALIRARETLEACGGYVPTTYSRVDPRWRNILMELAEEEKILTMHLEHARRGASQIGADAVDREPMTAAEAQQVLQELPILQSASYRDRQWWQEKTRGAPSTFKFEFAKAMEVRNITLARFREAFESSEHKSLAVVFHQLHAESIVSPDKPRPLRTLDKPSQKQWLRASEEHARSLDNFMQTDFAQAVRSHFVLHQFGRDGIAAFLDDNKRRLSYQEERMAKVWWDQLEGACSAESLLVLSQCIILVGATLDEFVQEIATGTDHGIAYAFAALRVKRSIQRLKVRELSKIEGWSDTELYLRLEDIKRQIAASEASEDAKRFWQDLETKNHTRRVLQLAEELALRGATLEEYFEAYLFSNSDNIQANLAYVDYSRLRKAAWDPSGPWPTIATLNNRNSRYTDTSMWSEERVANRLQAMVERVRLDQATEDAQSWWRTLKDKLPPSVLLRVAEELDLRSASIEELYRATVDGDTENIPATIAYLEVNRTKQNEARQAAQRATAFNQEGNRHYEKNEFAAAIESYEAAIRERPDDPVFYTNLSGAWLAHADIDYAQSLFEAEAVLQRGMANCPGNDRIERELKAVRIRSRLVERGGLSRRAQSMQMLPVVTPIALEVAADLISYYEEGDDPGMAAIFLMRDRIREASGVNVPGVRIRGNEVDMPPGTYLIMLNEVPLVMGTLDPSRVLTKVPHDELTKRGILYEEATDPLDGSDGAWISIEHASNLKERSWDLSEYIARHMEGVLLRNLVMFTGHTEVQGRLSDNWSSQARTILAEPTLLTAFTRTLQALLWEYVPTTDFEILCEGFLKQWSKTMHLDQTVAALRLLPAIREKLPGTQASTALLKLGQRLEQTLSSGLLDYGDVHILALEPEITQEALAAVRTIHDPKRPSAIVCEDAILRPYIRRLVELEFPWLHVIAVSELAPERLDSIEQEIELE